MLTEAAEGTDWQQTTEGNVIQFEALTPEGAVFLTELATLGYFGPETCAAVQPAAVALW